MLRGVHKNLARGGIITFHGDKPFIITSRSVMNPNPCHLAPQREEVEDKLQSLMHGQIKRLSIEKDIDRIIVLAESIAELAAKIKDPSEYL